MANGKKYHRKKTLKEEMSVMDVVVDKNSLSAKETRKLFKRGNAALNANNWPLAAKHFFKAWEADPDNLGLMTVVAHILSKLGHQAVAIEFLEKAIAKHGLTEDICKVMGEMALSLEMFEAAEKIFAQAVNFNPQEEKYYINIAIALEGQGNADGAIEFMEEVVKVLDQSSDCWCQLGTLYKANHRGFSVFRVAFKRALKLNPDNIIALNNYAGGLGAEPLANKLARQAIALSPTLPEPRILLSTYLLYHGELQEAWWHYEYRNDPSRGAEQTVQYVHGIERWTGQSLVGKTIFVTAEQGLGDEVYYFQALHKLLDLGCSLLIGCDKRLITILERSYPGARAFGYDDKVVKGVRYRSFPEFDGLYNKGELKADYSLPLASIPFHFWSETSEIKQFPDGYLSACEDEVKQWKEKFNSLGKKPKIGISWRSGYISKPRKRYYIGLENILPIIKKFDADFICLQYDIKQEELDEIRDRTGKSLIVFPEIDLKNDLEANLAIMSNLDLVLGPNIATQMLSLACGAKTCLTSQRPWWAWQSSEDNSIHHAPRSVYKVPKKMSDDGGRWDYLSADLAEMIHDLKKNNEVLAGDE